MPSFGERLKLEREKRKFTLEQISSTTKISTRMLQALEDEKFNQLPGGIFNKGFVRAYARTLGLDEDQAVADYLEASGDAPPFRYEPVREGARENPRAHLPHESAGDRLEIRAEVASRQLPWGIFAIVLLIIALALSLWNHRRREQERIALAKTQHPVTRPSNESAPSEGGPNSAPAGLSSATANPSSATGLSSPANPSSASRPSLVNQSTSSTPAASPTLSSSKSSLASPAPEAGAIPAVPAPSEFEVGIHARDDSWLLVIVDGKPTPSETLAAGQERTFRGRQRVIVKVGSAGALDFLLNGKTLPVGGDLGEVRTVTIGPRGLVQSAPASLPPMTEPTAEPRTQPEAEPRPN